MRVRLATAVTGAGHSHQAGVEFVLHVALEHAVFNQRGALGRRTFVVDAQRATATGQGAVIDNGAQLGGDHLAHAPTVGRTALAVEVAFQAVPYGFMEQHTGPARAQHHRQCTGWRGNGFQVDQCLTQRFTGIAHGTVFSEEIAVVGTPTTTMTATLAATVLLDDHADIETHQRPYICRQAAIGGRHKDALPHTGHAHGHLLDTRVEGTGGRVDTLEQVDLLRTADHFQGVIRRVQLGHVLGAERLHRAVLAGTGNRARRTGSEAKGFKGNSVAVGKAGLFTGLRAHTDALVKVETAFLDDAVFESPRLGNLALEIQIGRVDARPGQITEHGLQTFDGHATGCQEVFTD